jgi:hypothetical protein
VFCNRHVKFKVRFCLFYVVMSFALLIALLAIRMAHGHRFVFMLYDKCLFVVINVVLAIFCKFVATILI